MTYKLQMVFIDNVANALKFVSTTCHLKIKKKLYILSCTTATFWLRFALAILL